MPCGCQGRAASLPPTQTAKTRAPVEAKRVAVYNVIVDGETVLSTSSPSAARSESQRLGASIRVTSRPVQTGDPVPV
jgi:hypothetical protein